MFIANYLLFLLYDNLSFEEFPLPPLPIVSKTLSDTEKIPRKHVQVLLCSLARAQSRTQAGREGKRDREYREAQPFKEPQESSSSDPFTRGSRWCLDLKPRKKYLEQDDLVILKLFQTALKEQSLGQPMGGMNGIQFPAREEPTVSWSQPCKPANVYRALPLRSHVTLVKAVRRKRGW